MSSSGPGSVLVTGGAGYIGSHAVKGLLAEGHRVVVLDNLSAGHRTAIPGVELIEADTRDVPRVREALRRYEVSAVMHFAAWLSVSDSVKDPAGYYQNNVVGTLSVLDAMVSEGVRHFVFSSTAAVFGNPDETPITETHPTRPINAYGQTKLAVEHALPHYERGYGLRSMTLRYFNAAGADPDGQLGEDHQPEPHLIPRAIDAALGRDAFQVYGDDYDTPDGTCLRDYIHVTDLAAAHVLALGALRRGAPSATYNLGNGRPTSVRDVIESVGRVTGRQVPFTMGPRRAGDPGILYASSARIREELGWAPRYEAIDVIVETAWRWRATHPHGYGDRSTR